MFFSVLAREMPHADSLLSVLLSLPASLPASLFACLPLSPFLPPLQDLRQGNASIFEADLNFLVQVPTASPPPTLHCALLSD